MGWAGGRRGLLATPLVVAALLLAMLPLATTAPAVPTQQQACTTCHTLDRSITITFEVVSAQSNESLTARLKAHGPSQAAGRSALSFPLEVADNAAVAPSPRTVLDGSDEDLASGAASVEALVGLRPPSSAGPWTLLLFYSVGEPHVTQALVLRLDRGGTNGTLRLQIAPDDGTDPLGDVRPDPTGGVLLFAHALLAIGVLALEVVLQIHLTRLDRTLDGRPLATKRAWLRRLESLVTIQLMVLTILAVIGLVLLLYYQFHVGEDVIGRQLFVPKIALAAVSGIALLVAEERKFPRWRAVVLGEVPDAAVAATVRNSYVRLRRLVTVLLVVLWFVGGAFAHL